MSPSPVHGSITTALLVVAITAGVFVISHLVARVVKLRGIVPEPFSGSTHRSLIAAALVAGRKEPLMAEHVVVGLAKTPGVAREALKALSCDTRALGRALRSSVARGTGPAGSLSPDVQRALSEAAGQTRKGARVTSDAVLLAIVRTARGALAEVLARHGVSAERLETAMRGADAAGWADRPPL